jgi:hypothetical protein
MYVTNNICTFQRSYITFVYLYTTYVDVLLFFFFFIIIIIRLCFIHVIFFIVSLFYRTTHFIQKKNVYLLTIIKYLF